MKFLLIVFLSGLSLAAAWTFSPYSAKADVQFYDDQEDFNEVVFAEEGDDFANNLRERFEEILEKIKDAIENRKVLGGNVLAKFREIYNQMKEKAIPFGDKARELLEQMKEKATGIWKRILDKINPSKRSLVARGTGAENLRERLQELLEKLRESFRDRKLPGKGFLSKLREIRDEMRQKKVPLGGNLKEMIEKLKENANGVWRRILDRIGQHTPERSDEFEVLYEEDPKTELGRILKKHLDEILDKIKDIVDNGRTYKDDLVEKAKDIMQKLKDMKVDIGDHAKQVLKDLKEKAKDYWKKILDKFTFDSEINTQVYMEEPKTELAKILKKHFEEILEKLQDIIENGKTYKDDLVEKAKEIAQKLKDMKVDIGDHARQVIKDLKEKAKDYWKKVLDKLTLNSENSQIFGEEDNNVRNLRERLNEILEMVKDGFETRTTIGGQYLFHLETVWNEMKEKSILPGDRAIQLIEELKRKTNGEWKRLLFKLLPDEE